MEIFIMKKSLSILLFCLIALSLSAQENRRTAVVPFNAVGVSENEAMIITGLFETALVNTKSFSVIEQSQIVDIMEAQAYSLGGCTDESCAIEVGKLLSAEQIILGDLSTIGGKIILNAKIIDVEKGFNIKADNVEASGMGEMTTAVELLAYKLAGLTFTSGGNVQVAHSFGEILIETSPPGADIFINGVKKGVSPDLISRIPFGKITIEAKKDNLYAMKNIEVSSDTAMLSLSLEVQYGKIFIKSSDSSVDVYLDGKVLGPLGSGFFDNLSIGSHSLELKGDSVYWRDDVNVELGSSTKIDAYPQGYGLLSYSLPKGVQAEVSGNDFNRTISGEGRLNYVWVGRYTIRILGEKYVDYEENFQVNKDSEISFIPELVISQTYLENYFSRELSLLEESIINNVPPSLPVSVSDIMKIDEILSEIKASQYEFAHFQSQAEKLHKTGFTNMILPQIVSSEKDAKKGIGEITPQMATEVGELVVQIENTPYDFPSLLNRASQSLSTIKKKINLQNLYVEKSALEERIAVNKKTLEDNTIGGFIGLGIGAAGGILSGIMALIAESIYSDYMATTITSKAIEYRDQFKTLDLINYCSAGVAAIGLGSSLYFWGTSPEVDEDISKLSSLTANIAVMEAELK
jgi:TolB-like protein